MASKYLQKYPVPEQFPEVLHDFTREILREQPDDIVNFAVEYFQCLSEGKQYVPKSKYNPPKEADKPKSKLDYHSGPGKDIKPREGTAVHKPAPQPVQQVRPPSEKKPVEVKPTTPQGGIRKPTPPASAKSGKSSHRDQGQQAEPQQEQHQNHEQENEGTQTDPPARPNLIDNSYHVPIVAGETPQGDQPSVNRTNILSPKSDAITHPEEKKAAKDYMNDLNEQLIDNSNQDLQQEQQLSQVAHEQEEAAIQQAANDTSVNRQPSRPFSGKSGRSVHSARSQHSELTHKTEKNVAKGYMDDLTNGVLARVTPKGTVNMDNGGINYEPTQEQQEQHQAELEGEPERIDSQASPRE